MISPNSFQPPAICSWWNLCGLCDLSLLSHTSQVAMVRQGNQTTLTLANDYEGELSEFALVILSRQF